MLFGVINTIYKIIIQCVIFPFHLLTLLFFTLLYLIYHKIQRTIKQDSYTKANKSGEEAQKETMRLIDIGLPPSKNKVNSNSNSKARIESKIQ